MIVDSVNAIDSSAELATGKRSLNPKLIRRKQVYIQDPEDDIVEIGLLVKEGTG